MPDDLTIHVLIATHNRRELMERTLQSLANCNIPPEIKGIHVVENGSDDGTRAVCERMRDRLPVVYHHLEEGGKSRALQWYIDQLADEFVLFLDDDVRVEKDLFIKYVEAVRKEGIGHFYGGPVDVDYEKPPPSWLIRFLPKSAKGWDNPSPGTLGQGAELFLGCNYGAFAHDITECGGFNESLGPGATPGKPDFAPTGQEFEMQTRLVKYGVKPYYIPGALVWHWVPAYRCSPDFALRRARRNSIGSKLQGNHAGPLSLVEIGLWRIAYAILRLIRLLVSLVLSGQMIFIIDRQLYKTEGRMEGIKLARSTEKKAAAG